MSITLAALVADASLGPAATTHDSASFDASVAITAVTYDSRRVQRGSLFCCLRGNSSDGHEFAAAACAAGASALLVDHRLAIDVPQVVVPETREAMGRLSSAFFGHPSRSLTVVGVTGTNGKTTTTSLIASILEAAGRSTGIIGTLTGKHTTPEAPDLQQRLADFLAAGKKAVVMEVSSHALQLHRVAGTRFELAVFTNLGRDHLDLHGTIERYFAAKALLFDPVLSARGIANACLLYTSPSPRD